VQQLSLSQEAVRRIRAEIAKAHGNEVCFLASVDEQGIVLEPRVVARGHKAAVLAAVRDSKPGQIVLHNHPSGAIEPSNADLDVAARLYDNGLGFAIVDNDARELYIVLEPATPKVVLPLDPEEMAATLAPGGPVSLAHNAYEDRAMQRDLTRAVTRAYNEGGVAVLEAGTGTGKSVAYLIPAIYWAIKNRERTVVSTNTINLQEQLVRKDLPFLRRALGESFRFALVKGRGNYISIRRALLAQQTQTVLFDDVQQNSLNALTEWLKTTQDGSLQDLPFTPSPELWDEVVSDSDVCLRAKCPHFEQCFYQKARRDAAAADVIVSNHSLLFSDIAVRKVQGNYTAPAVLPPYKRVILDEAHNIEEAATEHLGAAITRRGLTASRGVKAIVVRTTPPAGTSIRPPSSVIVQSTSGAPKSPIRYASARVSAGYSQRRPPSAASAVTPASRATAQIVAWIAVMTGICVIGVDGSMASRVRTAVQGMKMPSTSGASTARPAATSCSVTARSSGLGVGSPLG